ncbi:hypothetical protein MKW98_014636 [Papaver atlanticum]|uniref:Transmembrane protein n=1 Tax=Papaver atlanticum TaxID=357466 RepID=A0AAD4XDJ8_9MAGN|nr:hypothetical protein MKW98_014636 [Papaver atlanticum]
MIMASTHQTLMIGMFIFLFLVLQQHCCSASARKLELHNSSVVGIPKIIKSPPVPTIDVKQTLPIIHRSKKIEDAFRPTSPGHSPGVGHGEPPGHKVSP